MPEGLAYFTQVLASSGTLSGVQATIANSAEAQSDLTALYRTELGRTPDAGGLAYFTQVLASGGTLSGVQATIANSAEAQSDLTALYRTELGRAPWMPEDLRISRKSSPVAGRCRACRPQLQTARRRSRT